MCSQAEVNHPTFIRERRPHTTVYIILALGNAGLNLSRIIYTIHVNVRGGIICVNKIKAKTVELPGSEVCAFFIHPV